MPFVIDKFKSKTEFQYQKNSPYLIEVQWDIYPTELVNNKWHLLLKFSGIYNSMLPSVYVSPLKLHSATKINLHGVSGSSLFRNHLKVRLSPLKSPVLRNSWSKYRRSVVYPSITKCNAKRCSCCTHLCCKSTIKSNVNGRQFSVI